MPASLVLNPGVHSGYALTMIGPGGTILLQSSTTPPTSAPFEHRTQSQTTQGKYYRQTTRYSDPLYASIPEDAEPHLQGRPINDAIIVIVIIIVVAS